MMSHILRRNSKLGMLVGYLAALGARCFVFSSGFRLAAMDAEGSDTMSPVTTDRGTPRRLAGVAAAIFLLAFVASEALATIAALRH